MKDTTPVLSIRTVPLSIFFLIAGINHFFMPEFYLRMVPPWLPSPLLLVQISGVAEAFGGLLVLMPKYRLIARWGLIALLIAVFPANIYMALHSELFPEFSKIGLLLRLPFQFLFILWVWWGTTLQRLVRP